MIDLQNEHEILFDATLLEALKKELTEREVELLIVSNEEMREINREHRGKDEPTDVLSFPLDAVIAHLPLGSILISYETAKEKSEELGHTLSEEIALLFLHGLLHLLGFDHETDKGEQREKEREIIEKLSLPPSLIIRSEDG